MSERSNDLLNAHTILRDLTENSSLYALNTSASVTVNLGSGPSKVAGALNFEVRELNGTPARINIPVSTIPVELTASASPMALKRSPELKRLVTAGFIRLVPVEEAHAQIYSADGMLELAATSRAGETRDVTRLMDYVNKAAVRDASVVATEASSHSFLDTIMMQLLSGALSPEAAASVITASAAVITASEATLAAKSASLEPVVKAALKAIALGESSSKKTSTQPKRAQAPKPSA